MLTESKWATVGTWIMDQSFLLIHSIVLSYNAPNLCLSIRRSKTPTLTEIRKRGIRVDCNPCSFVASSTLVLQSIEFRRPDIRRRSQRAISVLAPLDCPRPIVSGLDESIFLRLSAHLQLELPISTDPSMHPTHGKTALRK